MKIKPEMNCTGPRAKAAAKRVTTYIRRRGISQVEFARECGVSTSMVCLWMQGARGISAGMAVKLEKATKGGLTRKALRPDLFN